jgi:hypothetical protein
MPIPCSFLTEIMRHDVNSLLKKRFKTSFEVNLTTYNGYKIKVQNSQA